MCRISRMGGFPISGVSPFGAAPSATALLQQQSAFYHMTVLDLSLNHLRNIGGLDGMRIQVLDLSRNQLSKISGLEACKTLQHLNLSTNAISQVQGLGGLAGLRHLDLSFNSIAVVDVPDWAGMAQLRELNLASNQLCPDLSGLRLSAGSLEALHLSGNKLEQLDEVAHLPLLRVLQAGRNQLADLDRVCKAVGVLGRLQQLGLAGNPIAEALTYRLRVLENDAIQVGAAGRRQRRHSVAAQGAGRRAQGAAGAGHRGRAQGARCEM
jgi:Leucine-rich repeat (LRR) protein